MEWTQAPGGAKEANRTFLAATSSSPFPQKETKGTKTRNSLSREPKAFTRPSLLRSLRLHLWFFPKKSGRHRLTGAKSRHGTPEEIVSSLVSPKYREGGGNAEIYPFTPRQIQNARRQAVCRMDGGTEPRRKGIGRKTVSTARRFGRETPSAEITIDWLKWTQR